MGVESGEALGHIQEGGVAENERTQSSQSARLAALERLVAALMSREGPGKQNGEGGTRGRPTAEQVLLRPPARGSAAAGGGNRVNVKAGPLTVKQNPSADAT